jgi:hypothetical protein
MKDKNLDMGDGALRQDITRRFMWTPPNNQRLIS